jgi:hypothetical protein
MTLEADRSEDADGAGSSKSRSKALFLLSFHDSDTADTRLQERKTFSSGSAVSKSLSPLVPVLLVFAVQHHGDLFA